MKNISHNDYKNTSALFCELHPLSSHYKQDTKEFITKVTMSSVEIY